MGDLLYSLPLAPGEKRQIAIVDWHRRERAARDETTDSAERLTAAIERERDVSDIVKSILSEDVHGESSATTAAIAGGAGFAAGNFVIGVSGGYSTSNSAADNTAKRELSASRLQYVHDRTSQAASAVRTQRTAVVQTVGQDETTRVETSVVANHNHCHALTIQYFEVLRHLQVKQQIAQVQECLFIPLQMSRFDNAKVLRWREILESALRKPELRAGFDAIEAAQNNFRDSDLPEGRYADENIESLNGELLITFYLPRPRDADDDKLDQAKVNSVQAYVSPQGMMIFRNAKKDERDYVWRRDIAPRLAEKLVQNMSFYYNNSDSDRIPLDAALVSTYSDNTPLTVRLNATGESIERSRNFVQGIRIKIENTGTQLLDTLAAALPDSKMIVHSGRLNFSTAHINGNLFSRVIKDDLKKDDSVFISTPLRENEKRNPRRQQRELARKLLAHLNEYMEYYHRAIWMKMDADRRFMLLDGFTLSPENAQSVASVVENRLIGRYCKFFQRRISSKTFRVLKAISATLSPLCSHRSTRQKRSAAKPLN